MYHYVRDLKNSRFPEIKGLNFNSFIEQIEYFRKNYHFVTAEQVAYSLDSGDKLPEKAVLLTFDDAYIDHYTHVFPYLNRLGIQGCFYVPVKAVSENTVLDVNKIHFTLAGQPDKSRLVRAIESMLNEYRVDHPIESFDQLRKKYAKSSVYDTAEVMLIKNLLQHGLPLVVRQSIADALFVQTVGMDESTFSRELYMSSEQVNTMIRHGMHVGCHGYDHYWWNKLDRVAVEQEIDRSMAYLFGLGVRRDLWSTCYPYGSHDEQAVTALSQRGCKFALTTEVRVADLQRDNRLTLPRLDTNDFPINRGSELGGRYFEH